ALFLVLQGLGEHDFVALACCFWHSKSAASPSLDARLSNDPCPFGAFGPEQGSSLIRRIADCLEAKHRHFLHDVRQRDDLDDLAMEQRGNLLRCAGWND